MPPEEFMVSCSSGRYSREVVAPAMVSFCRSRLPEASYW